jgi:hypothetical protein
VGSLYFPSNYVGCGSFLLRADLYKKIGKVDVYPYGCSNRRKARR